MTLLRRLLPSLVFASLFQAAAGAPFIRQTKDAPRFRGEQTLTVSSIPKAARPEGGLAIGSSISISGNWIAVRQDSLLSTPVIHLFQRRSNRLWLRKPWKWRAAVACGYGDIHLHDDQLISPDPESGLQIHRLENGQWIKIQNLATAVGNQPIRLIGRNGKMAVGQEYLYSSFSAIQALDFDSASNSWKIEDVVYSNSAAQPWVITDRCADRIIGCEFASGKAATIFEKGPAGWSPAGDLSPPASHNDTSSLWAPPSYDALFTERGTIAVLAKHSDFIGNPIRNTLLQYQLDPTTGVWQHEEEREVDWPQSRLVMIGDHIAMYGARTDFLGNSLPGQMVLFDEHNQKVSHSRNAVANMSWSTNRLITSDCVSDFLGNTVGTGVKIYRMTPPKSAR